MNNSFDNLEPGEIIDSPVVTDKKPAFNTKPPVQSWQQQPVKTEPRQQHRKDPPVVKSEPPSAKVEQIRPLVLPRPNSKQSSLFSPPVETERKNPFSSGPEVRKDKTAIETVTIKSEKVHVERKPISAILKIEQKEHDSDEGREKRHKEKKKKKEKKKDREHHHHQHSSSDTAGGTAENGEIPAKKHKHKHKERSKDRDRESSKEVFGSALNTSVPGIKLKIKAMPPVAPPPPLAPLKISLSHMSSGDGDHRKRPRQVSDSSSEGGSSGTGPASKMSRVLGTSLEAESQFFNAVGGGGGTAASGNGSHHLSSSKSSSKKVIKDYL